MNQTALKIPPEPEVEIVTINGGNELLRRRLAEALGAKVRPDGSFQITVTELDRLRQLINEFDRGQ